MSARDQRAASKSRVTVLDLRERHVAWEIHPDRPSTVNDPDYADRMGVYHAILRDGRKSIVYIAEEGRDAGHPIVCFTGTVESLRRLRDTLDRFLGDA